MNEHSFTQTIEDWEKERGVPVQILLESKRDSEEEVQTDGWVSSERIIIRDAYGPPYFTRMRVIGILI